MPGYCAEAHPYPQEVAPWTYHVPPLSQTSGPPLSPWHASTMSLPLVPCAHNMLASITPEPYFDPHSASLTIVTSPSCSVSG